MSVYCDFKSLLISISIYCDLIINMYLYIAVDVMKKKNVLYGKPLKVQAKL